MFEHTNDYQLLLKQRKEDQGKKPSQHHPNMTQLTTSISPHSNTRRSVELDARPTSTPTTFVQYVASASARVIAGVQRTRSFEQTPRKSIKTRVTTSGVGEMFICAAISNDSCAMNRNATNLCLCRYDSQNLSAAVPQESLRVFPVHFVCFLFVFCRTGGLICK